MKLTKHLILVTFSLSFLFLNCNEVKIKKYEKDNGITERTVVFLDDNKNIIKSINLVEENPYNSLPYEVEKKNRNGHNSYMRIPHSEIFKDRSIFKVKQLEEIYFVYGYPIVSVNLKQKGYVIISYSLQTRVDEFYTGSIITTEIYNVNGDLINKLEDMISGNNNFRITSDGKYLTYRSGNDMGENSLYNSNFNIQIYDLLKDEIVFRREALSGYILRGVGTAESMVFLSMKREKTDIIRYEVVNCDDREIYSIELNREQRSRIKNKNNKGFILGVSSIIDENEELLEYKLDFELEKY